MKYPTMKEIQVDMTHGACFHVGATVSLHTGKPVVEIRQAKDDGSLLTPIEAERLAKALLRAATCARAKAAHRG